MMETLDEKIKRVLNDNIEIVPYDRKWPDLFKQEKKYLLSSLPPDLVKRVEHFGSTAIPGISSKPIIDMLVEVTSLDETRKVIVPILECQGYDYFWRPTWDDNVPPFYAWFIKRNRNGKRTHHIHMVEKNFEHWERLFFRDYLIEHHEIAAKYQTLKIKLSEKYRDDRIAYTNAKTNFIVEITKKAKIYYFSL